MSRLVYFALLSVCGASIAAAEETKGDVVFRSDVSLVRVDAQVVDGGNRAITGLHREDFVLRESGKVQEIRNFARENMPVDVVMLLDVSASMRPHIQRIADAAGSAVQVLKADDRVAIMVFDRSTRVRMPFRGLEAVQMGLNDVLRQENFRGGTDITRGILDAAQLLRREGRKDARRAVVIVTDDQTERNRDEEGVTRALTNADAVLMAIIAPDAMSSRNRGGGGSYPGGGYPGGGRRRSGGIGFPGGGYPGGGYPGGGYPGGGYPGGGYPGGGYPGGGYPGGGYPGGGSSRYPGGNGPVVIGGHTQSAGTSEIAHRTGGDSLTIDDATALETTLSRIRQRYALYFYLPAGVKPGEERQIEVALSDAGRRRYPDGEVRYRREYLAPGGSSDSGSGGSIFTPTSSTSTVEEDADPPTVRRSGSSGTSGSSDQDTPPRLKRRRPNVDDSGSRSGPVINTQGQGGWRRDTDPEPPSAAADPAPAPSSQPAPAPVTSSSSSSDSSSSSSGGWRKATASDVEDASRTESNAPATNSKKKK